jgi:hypothetical protein
MKTSPFMSIGSILFTLAMGGAMFYTFFNWGKVNRVIESWPKTKGKILSTDVLGRQLVVKYEFFVNGARFESDKIYRYLSYYELGVKWGKLNDFNELEFIKNPEVKYNPQNPADCCLILYYEKTWLRVVIFIASLIFSLIGLFGLLDRILQNVEVK